MRSNDESGARSILRAPRRTTTRREFLRNASLAGAAGALLWGSSGTVPLAREAEAQTVTPAPPGWLEDRDPAARTFSYGVPMNPYELGDEAAVRAILDRAKNAGADEVAVGVFWPTVQPQQGAALNLYPVDYTLQQAQARGIAVSLYVAGTPDWVHPDLKNTEPDAIKRQQYAPIRNATEVSHYEQYLAKIVERYGTRVLRYKIWNEPNNPQAFAGYARSASAAPYAKLMRISYRAIKTKLSGTTVTFGGLSVNDEEWFQWYYNAAKAYSDAAANKFFFDEMDFHCYTQGNSHEYTGFVDDGRATGIRKMPAMKALMDRNGDTNKKVRVGETGFTTQGNAYFKPVPDDRRALFLKQIYSRARQDFGSFLTGVTWFTFHPAVNSSAEWAMLDANRVPNRTYQALREASGWNLSKKCYPRIPDGGIVSGRWKVEPVWEGGAAPTDVYRYELYVGGLLEKDSASAPFEVEASNVKVGKQEVILAAYTRSGSVYSARPVVLEFRSGVPTITNASPAPGTTTTDRTPLIQAYVSDAETDLQRSAIKVTLDGKAITYFGYDTETNRLWFIPTLAPGLHKVRIEATDSGPNTRPYEWGFNVR